MRDLILLGFAVVALYVSGLATGYLSFVEDRPITMLYQVNGEAGQRTFKTIEQCNDARALIRDEFGVGFKAVCL